MDDRAIMDEHWLLEYDSFEPDSQGLREALCTLGNGYFCTRGAAPEATADDVDYPGTYLAGGYDRRKTDIAGHTVENEDLVNFPDWTLLEFRIAGGEWFELGEVDILSFRQTLNLRGGYLMRSVRFTDKRGWTTRVTSRRFVHMRHMHLAGQELTIEAEDWSGAVEFRSTIDGRVDNKGVARYSDLTSKHHEPREVRLLDDAESAFLRVGTIQSHVEVAMCARTRVYERNDRIEPERTAVHDPAGLIGHQFKVDITEAEAVTVEKLVTVYTDRDRAISECGLEARRRIEQARSFDAELADHIETWSHLWRRFDIGMDLEAADGEVTHIEGHHPALVLRLHVFHLLQTASPHTMDLDVGVPARGWHGEAYRGHIFWDELFIFPMLNLRMPEITRSLLRYRYRRMDKARVAAQKAGYRGAMFPWQSGSNGREESQTLHLNPRSGNWNPDNTRLQRHVSADIAYNVWQYYQITDDLEFLSYYGAEMILEIARFWASIAEYDSGRDRYVIRGVVGPDEYHDAYPPSHPRAAADTDRPGLDNNAFTNVMAVWVILRALDLLDRVPIIRRDELRDKLDITQAELDAWHGITTKMYVPFIDGEDCIIAQFEGYGELAEFDWEGYRDKYDNIQRLDRILEAEDDTPNRYKASKQADVLMLNYLFSDEEICELFERLGYDLDAEAIGRNIDYYMARTSHGSTLSGVVHAYVIADRDKAASWQMFRKALKSDIADIQGGTTPEGIHLGAMAGTVDLVQRVYAGLEVRGDDVLRINPSLPDELARLHLDIRFRSHSLAITITPERLRVSGESGPASPIRVGIGDEICELCTGEAIERRIEG